MEWTEIVEKFRVSKSRRQNLGVQNFKKFWPKNYHIKNSKTTGQIVLVQMRWLKTGRLIWIYIFGNATIVSLSGL